MSDLFHAELRQASMSAVDMEEGCVSYLCIAVLYFILHLVAKTAAVYYITCK